MYSEAKYKGDDYTIGEELLMDIPELEEKAKLVEKSVHEGYFTLDEALELYKVSAIEYVAYSLLKNRSKLEGITTQLQAIGALSIVVEIFHEASNKFDPQARIMMGNVEKFAKNSAITKLNIEV